MPNKLKRNVTGKDIKFMIEKSYFDVQIIFKPGLCSFKNQYAVTLET